jgi:pimeloyl-ACP methyl ester carboxylesterase
MQAPIQKQQSIGDIDLAYFEWGQAEAGKPTLLFIHATGFHARCWDQVIAQLGDVHAIAVDQRGHGRSGKAGDINWPQFGNDMKAFVRALDLKQIIGIGHSIGGHVMSQTAADQGERFLSLLLVDPVIMPPKIYAMDLDLGDEHPVSRRKRHFDSVDEMLNRFESREPYSLWDKQVLHDFCEYGLLPDGDGFTLACPPEVEAQIYLRSMNHDIYDLLPTITQPVLVLRAKQENGDEPTFDLGASPTYSRLAEHYPNAEDHHFPDLTHFIPMQRPAMVADYIKKLLAAV